MARSITTLEGFSDLEKRLKALPENIARRGTVRALRRASEKMASAVEERAPVGATGNLAGSVRIKARTRSTIGLSEYAETLRGGGSYRDAQQALRAARVEAGSGATGARVTVEVGVYSPVAHLVEYGTVERRHASGKSTGAMPMKPFVRPAFDSEAASCALLIRTELKVEIEKMELRTSRAAARADRRSALTDANADLLREGLGI